MAFGHIHLVAEGKARYPSARADQLRAAVPWGTAKVAVLAHFKAQGRGRCAVGRNCNGGPYEDAKECCSAWLDADLTRNMCSQP